MKGNTQFPHPPLEGDEVEIEGVLLAGEGEGEGVAPVEYFGGQVFRSGIC